MSRSVLSDLSIAVLCIALAWLLAAGTCACGDNRNVSLDAHELEDAPMFDATAVDVVQVGCCVNYPDENAIRECASAQLPPESCGVLVCPRPPEDGGGNLKINACGPFPVDAGVDAP